MIIIVGRFDQRAGVTGMTVYPRNRILIAHGDQLDVANAVLFLASEESRNVSGHVLTVASGNNHSL